MDPGTGGHPQPARPAVQVRRGTPCAPRGGVSRMDTNSLQNPQLRVQPRTNVCCPLCNPALVNTTPYIPPYRVGSRWIQVPKGVSLPPKLPTGPETQGPASLQGPLYIPPGTPGWGQRSPVPQSGLSSAAPQLQALVLGWAGASREEEGSSSIWKK
jgi:hypothetical protein